MENTITSNNNTLLPSNTNNVSKEVHDRLLQAMRCGNACVVLTDAMCKDILNNMGKDTHGQESSLPEKILINNNEK